MPQYDSQFEENLYQLRREKLDQIAALARAADPSLSDYEAKYPNCFTSTTSVPELRALGEHLSTEELERMHIEAAVAGRIMAIRVQGKAGFAQIQQHGQRLQIYVRKDDVGTSPEQSEALFNLYKQLDLGDHIGVRGYLMRTRTGELTLHAAPVTLPAEKLSAADKAPAVRAALTFLSKAMLALPDKFHGLEDIELRYRRRYLDLFTDTGDTAETPTVPPTEPGAPGLASETWVEPPLPSTPTLTRLPARDVFVKRAAILRSVRHFFDRHGYLEVETPMLHTIAGGAAARTFSTHHNAEDMELTLRVAPELHLKRLVVGGLDRVYEINRNFRNEGTDRSHNPEFTMLEFYQAYANYHDLMQLTKDLIVQVAQDVNGTTLTKFNGTEINLAPENWQQLTMREAIIKFWRPSFQHAPCNDDFLDKQAFGDVLTRAMQGAQSELMATESIEDLGRRTSARKVAFDRFDAIQKNRRALLLDGGELGKSIADLFEAVAEEHLIQPTIIYDYPLAVSPLSKPKPDEPDWVERFEFYIGGFELGNGFSELNDPDDQLRRFEAQLEDRKRGDAEAMAEIDYDYVRALGYGLPPTAGEGIGIDRLTMILTGSRTIRDVILFPLMRPQKPVPEPTPTQATPTQTAPAETTTHEPQPHGESTE